MPSPFCPGPPPATSVSTLHDAIVICTRHEKLKVPYFGGTYMYIGSVVNGVVLTGVASVPSSLHDLYLGLNLGDYNMYDLWERLVCCQ